VPLPEGAAGDAGLILRRLLEGGGISTSNAVTEASGRGIGLDVVREVVARLGGRATLRTQPGEGTTLDLEVPVSLASLEALVVEASGARAAIPVSAIQEAIRVDRSEMAHSADGDSIRYEGALIPFLPLAQAIGQEPGGARDGRMWSAVVLRGRGGRAALGVDRLLGRTTLIVRPLPALASVGPIIAGASLDAEGNPQPVLDSDRVIEAAQQTRRTVRAPATPLAPILVVDDSLTTRMLEQSILESAGYPVELASSGEEALEKARHQHFRLFLVDVEMPGMDGFTLLEQLRQDPVQHDIPAFLVTSRDTPEDRARGARVGARAYIVKSEFDQAELLERIRGLVG
jgi:two-component system chemotaxis sensor kinase CheA